MQEYREALYRMRRGERDRGISRDRVLGRVKVGRLRLIAEQEGWLDPSFTLPSEPALLEAITAHQKAQGQRAGEPLLVKHAAARGACFLFNTEYLGYTELADGVSVLLKDRNSGREYWMRARYLVGADGARSKVMDDAGLKLDGELSRAGTAR